MTASKKLPANTWEVILLVRKRGAIGIFYPRTLNVRAWPDKVTDWALSDANDLGFEVSHILKAERIA